MKIAAGMRWVVLAAACVLAGQWISRADHDHGPQAGAPVQDFTVQRLDGSALQLSKLHGQVVVLNFWATWCPACREELPEVSAFALAHERDCVQVLGLSAEDGATLDRFTATRALAYPVVTSESDLEARFGVSVLPTTVIIDPEGKIAARIEGGTSQRALEGIVAPLLPAGALCQS